MFQVRLPSYSEHYNHQQENERLVRLFQEGKDEWEGTLKPDDGNVAVIFRGGLMIHTGLMIAQGSRILHVQEGCETVHEPMIRFSIEGIYRRPKGKSDLSPAD